MGTVYTREPIFTHNSLKDAGWLKEMPCKDVYFDFPHFGGRFPLKPPEFRRQ
jgi:hypothetical protein